MNRIIGIAALLLLCAFATAQPRINIKYQIQKCMDGATPVQNCCIITDVFGQQTYVPCDTLMLREVYADGDSLCFVFFNDTLCVDGVIGGSLADKNIAEDNLIQTGTRLYDFDGFSLYMTDSDTFLINQAASGTTNIFRLTDGMMYSKRDGSGGGGPWTEFEQTFTDIYFRTENGGQMAIGPADAHISVTQGGGNTFINLTPNNIDIDHEPGGFLFLRNIPSGSNLDSVLLIRDTDSVKKMHATEFVNTHVIDIGEVYMINDSTLVHVSSSGDRDTVNVIGAGGDSFWSHTGNYLYPTATATDSVGIGISTPKALLHVGDTTDNLSVDASILLSRSVNNSVSGNGHGYTESSIVNRSGVIGYNSYDAVPLITGTVNYDHYSGFQSRMRYGSSGTMTNLYAHWGDFSTTAGTITNAHLFYADDPSGAGAITNLYGVYVDALTEGTAENFALFTAGTTKSSFGGNVGIGTTTPVSLLDVTSITGGIATLRRNDTSVSANDMIGKLQFYAADASTSTNNIVANIEAQATNTISTNINPGRLLFRTTGTGVGAAISDRMRIDENGQLRVHEYDATPFTGTTFGFIAHETDGDFISLSKQAAADTIANYITFPNPGGSDSIVTCFNGDIGFIEMGDTTCVSIDSFYVIGECSYFIIMNDTVEVCIPDGTPGLNIYNSNGAFTNTPSGARVVNMDTAALHFRRGTTDRFVINNDLSTSIVMIRGGSGVVKSQLQIRSNNLETGGAGIHLSGLTDGTHVRDYSMWMNPAGSGSFQMYEQSTPSDAFFQYYGFLDSIVIPKMIQFNHKVLDEDGDTGATGDVLVAQADGTVNWEAMVGDSIFNQGGLVCIITSAMDTICADTSFYDEVLMQFCVVLLNDTTCVSVSGGTGAVPISSLLPAVATNTINNGNFPQLWQWNTLAGSSGLNLSSTSTAAASNAQRILAVSLSGANANGGQETSAILSSNTHTGGTSTNYGVKSTATGGTFNYGVHGTSSGSIGFGVYGTTNSSSGSGVYAHQQSTTGYALISHSSVNNSNSILPHTKFYRTNSTGTAANGIGLSLDFVIETNGGVENGEDAGSIEVSYTDATDASETSAMDFYTTNASTVARKMRIAGSGQLTLDTYGSGTHTGTATKFLAVTSAGLVIEEDDPGGAGGPIPINDLLAADGTNTIDNGAHQQIWQWNTLADDVAMLFSANTTLATANNQSVLGVNLSGANANSNQITTAFGAGNDHTGTNATNIAVYGASTGGTTNIGVRGSATGAGGVGLDAIAADGSALQGIGALSSYLVLNSAGTNDVVSNLKLNRRSTGSPANGIGLSLEYGIETSTTQDQSAGLLSFLWSDVTHATRTSRFELSTVNSGTTARKFAIAGSGQITADTYGDGTHTGTITTRPGFDVNGNIVEENGYAVLANGRPVASLINSTTSDQDFSSIYTVVASHLTTGRTIRVTILYETVTGVSTATAAIYLKLGSTKVYIPTAGDFTNSLTRSGSLSIDITGTAAAGAAAAVHTGLLAFPFYAVAAQLNTVSYSQNQATNGTLVITPGVTYSATGSTETVTLVNFKVEQLN